MVICAIASIISTSCNNSKRKIYVDTNTVVDTTETASTPQDSPTVTQETPAVTEEPQESEESKIAGTYTVTDKLKNTWVFKLNDDKTATIQKKGHEGIIYASWYILSESIVINCDDKRPVIVFPNLDEMSGYTKIRDGYLYVDSGAASSKNPERRLKITKTN